MTLSLKSAHDKSTHNFLFYSVYKQAKWDENITSSKIVAGVITVVG